MEGAMVSLGEEVGEGREPAAKETAAGGVLPTGNGGFLETSKPRRAIQMAAEGIGVEEIAKEIGMELRNVCTMLESPLAVEEIRKLEREIMRSAAQREGKDLVQTELLLNSLPAARKLGELVKSDKAGVALKASSEVLRMAGYSEPQRVEVGHTISLPDGVARLLLETMEMLSVKPVDVGYREVKLIGS